MYTRRRDKLEHMSERSGPGETHTAGCAKNLWRRWKALAHRIGDFQARVILAIFYFVVLAPFAALLRWTSDPLVIAASDARGWQERKEDAREPMKRASQGF